jgi:hypothetical protein
MVTLKRLHRGVGGGNSEVTLRGLKEKDWFI